MDRHPLHSTLLKYAPEELIFLRKLLHEAYFSARKINASTPLGNREDDRFMVPGSAMVLSREEYALLEEMCARVEVAYTRIRALRDTVKDEPPSHEDTKGDREDEE